MSEVRVFLGGEGQNELGSRSGHPVHQSDDDGRTWRSVGEGLTSRDIHALVVVPGAGTGQPGTGQRRGGGGQESHRHHSARAQVLPRPLTPAHPDRKPSPRICIRRNLCVCTK